jgi:outer membrane protein TolC
MYKIRIDKNVNSIFVLLALLVVSCNIPKVTTRNENETVPTAYEHNTDTANAALTNWAVFFKDPDLISLIDTALKHNQELLITAQEIVMSKNEVIAKKAAYLPTVNLGGGAGVEKVGLYTSQGAGDASANITNNKKVPEWLPNFQVGLFADWEIDIWKKLRNAKEAAVNRYLATVEGRNFAITNLVAEIANSYYELLALDNQLTIVRKNIEIQKNAL